MGDVKPWTLSPPVVQLFNAVSQHTKEVQSKVKAVGSSERKKAKGQIIVHANRRGFLLLREKDP